MKIELFWGCNGLTSLDFGSGVTSIGDDAFQDCALVGDLVTPDSVKGIGRFAFMNCCNITTLVIPDSVANIGDYAFYSCSDLTEFSILSVEPPVAGDGIFYDCDELTVIYVPDESVEAYTTADDWSDYTDLIKPLSEKPNE